MVRCPERYAEQVEVEGVRWRRDRGCRGRVSSGRNRGYCAAFDYGAEVVVAAVSVAPPGLDFDGFLAQPLRAGLACAAPPALLHPESVGGNHSAEFAL